MRARAIRVPRTLRALGLSKSLRLIEHPLLRGCRDGFPIQVRRRLAMGRAMDVPFRVDRADIVRRCYRTVTFIILNGARAARRAQNRVSPRYHSCGMTMLLSLRASPRARSGPTRIVRNSI